MSTRADVFPVEYVEELSRLQDALPPSDVRESARALERELGVSLDFFERFDETPVAAASLACSRCCPQASLLRSAVSTASFR